MQLDITEEGGPPTLTYVSDSMRRDRVKCPSCGYTTRENLLGLEVRGLGLMLNRESATQPTVPRTPGNWRDDGPMKKPVIFRINDNGSGPELLQQVFLERGWIEYDDEIHGPDDWHLWWRTTRFRTGEYNNLLPWQHINHFPSCTLITKKDALCRNLRKMKIIHGLNVYNFSPKAFNLPNDYTKFVSEYAAHRQKNKKDSNPSMWICKPAESSRGRGIFIFNELSELQYDCNAVVQHYIDDPLLIGGYKFDIRIYVAIPSFHPLQVYIHEEGLVRFSTEKYDLAKLDNVFAHLTNTSINKFSPGYTADKEEVGHGCKWTISQLRRYFLQNNIDDTRIWQQIINIVILTVLMQAPTAPKMMNCFELYGFDILIDNSLKAWLLEVNFSPALSSDCHADIAAKKTMLHDLMSLIQVPETDNELASNDVGGLHNLGGDLDTARTVASTTSLASHSSGMTSFRTNNGYGRLSSNNNHSSDSHRRVPRGRYAGSSGSVVAKDKMNGHASSSFHNTNTKRSSGTDRSPKVTPKGSSSHCSLSEDNRTPHPSRSGSAKAGLKKSGSLPHINGSTNDEHSRSKRNSLVTNGNNDLENEVFHDSSIINSTNDIPDPSAIVEKYVSDIASPSDAPNINTNNGDTAVQSKDINNHNLGRSAKLNGFSKEKDDICEEEEGKYEIKVVKGNMKGQGWKKIVSPIPAVKQNKVNKVTSLAMARRHGRQSSTDEYSRRTDPSVGSPQQRQQFHGPTLQFTERDAFNNTTNARYLIPRNFSRLEASRFPHAHHHARASNVNPGKNGTAPLSRIPQKQVGRLFLVFPFNEATQKISIETFDPKLVIKELLRQDSKNRKAVDGQSSPSMSNSGGIWPSLRCS